MPYYVVKSTGFQFLFTSGKEKKKNSRDEKRLQRHINQMLLYELDLV